MLKRKIIRGLTMTLAVLLAGVFSRFLYLQQASISAGSFENILSSPESRESLQETERYQNLYAEGELTLSPLPKKAIFLTFDDGPSKNTEKILDILSEFDAKATFFLIGENLTEEGIKIAKRALSEGHMLGLHTNTHQYEKIYSSVDSFLSDYNELAGLFLEQFGMCPNIYRFPGGSCSCFINPIRTELKQELSERGFFGYDWTASGEDAVGKPTAASIKKNIFLNLSKQEAPILLLHDAAGNGLTAELLSDVLKQLKEEGYTFLTLKNRKPYQFPW